MGVAHSKKDAINCGKELELFMDQAHKIMGSYLLGREAHAQRDMTNIMKSTC